MRTLSARLFLVAACCGLALTRVPAAGAAPSVLLRYHFIAAKHTPNQLVLDLAGTIPVMAPNLALTEVVPFTQTVQKVYPDGSALLKDSFTTATETTNGQTTTTPLTGASVTEHVAPSGQVISSKVVGLQSLTGGETNIDPTGSAPVFPTSPVAVGSQWTAQQHISLGSFGTVGGPVHYKLVALAPVNGHMVATIQEQGVWPVSVTQGLMQVTGTATVGGSVQFDTVAGALVSNHIVTKVGATFGSGGVSAGQPAPINLTLHLNVDRTK
jgi:hypothetical protein